MSERTESQVVAAINRELEPRPINLPLVIACVIAPSLAYIAFRIFAHV